MINLTWILYNLKIGDRVIVPKSSIRLIQHHAIFLGSKNGHYWFIENKEGYGVRVVNEIEFFEDVIEITKIKRFKPTSNYSRKDLYNYALSKVGTEYSLLNYNCESFANDVQNGKVHSSQANFGIVAALALFAITLISSTSNER